MMARRVSPRTSQEQTTRKIRDSLNELATHGNFDKFRPGYFECEIVGQVICAFNGPLQEHHPRPAPQVFYWVTWPGWNSSYDDWLGQGDLTVAAINEWRGLPDNKPWAEQPKVLKTMQATCIIAARPSGLDLWIRWSGVDPQFADEGLTFVDSEWRGATRKLLSTFENSYARHVFTKLESEALQQPQSAKDLLRASAQEAMLRTVLDVGLTFRAINKYDGVPMHLPSTAWVCLREKLLEADCFHKASSKQVHDYCLCTLALGKGARGLSMPCDHQKYGCPCHQEDHDLFILDNTNMVNEAFGIRVIEKEWMDQGEMCPIWVRHHHPLLLQPPSLINCVCVCDCSQVSLREKDGQFNLMPIKLSYNWFKQILTITAHVLAYTGQGVYKI